jgi:electron transfer flavoprotein alpha subunit
MATLQPGYFSIPYQDSARSGQAEQVEIDLAGVAGRLTWTNLSAAVSLPSPPLERAKVIVSAGRGMGDAEGFVLVEQLAKALGGQVAGSRGAFDEGWIGEEQIVGIGGKLIAPDLYIACGISGDLYHSFALENAKFIVAINADEQAPIFRLANMSLVGDAREIIPAMLEALAS